MGHDDFDLGHKLLHFCQNLDTMTFSGIVLIAFCKKLCFSEQGVQIFKIHLLFIDMETTMAVLATLAAFRFASLICVMLQNA